MDVTPDEVVRELEQAQCQIMIHGHTHRPDIHQLTANGEPAERWVLGDWCEKLWWIEATATNSQLKLDLQSQNIES